MRLDQRLVAEGFFESRSKAQAAVAAGRVRVDGRVAAKASTVIGPEARLEASPAHPWVGRGGIKLDHALSIWPIEVAGRVVLDVGASTGGFTDVCLQRGARRVYAVDVGRDQLHPSLRTDPRVVVLERTDARDLTAGLVPEAPELIVSDVSFISLTKALPAALGLAAPSATLVALVKPQFEAGPDAVSRGGLVREAEARLAAEASVSAFLQRRGWTTRASADSPITGGDGNVERLLWASRP